MKKKHVLVLAIILFSFFIADSKTVDVNVAQSVARNLYSSISKTEINQISVAYIEQNDDGVPVYYIFNINTNDGFVIISADDAALPVLGYTLSGSFDKMNCNPEFAWWLKGYKQQITLIKANHILSTAIIDNNWQKYISGQQTTNNERVSITSIGPLLTTNWGENIYFNALCPHHSPTGCVAVTMAQIMKYWNYPVHGIDSSSYCDCQSNGFVDNYGTLSANYGSTTYQWSSMPNNVNSSSTAVATLMFQCGVSVHMDYDSATGSGAFSIIGDDLICAQTSYAKYFGYNANTMQGLYRANFADSS